MKLKAAIAIVCLLLFSVPFLFSTNKSYAQTTCISLGDLDCSGVVNLGDLTRLLGSFGQASPAADVDGSGTVNLTDLSILLSRFGQTVQLPDPQSTCYGMVQVVYSPDDPNYQSLGRAAVKVNTENNIIDYHVLSAGYPSTNTVTMQLPQSSHTLPLTGQEGEILHHQGTISYQENEEVSILQGDMKANFIHIPFQSSPVINGYAYFGSNFTPTACDTPLFATERIVPSITPTPPVIWTATHEAGTSDEWRINENTEPAQDSNYCARPLNGVSNEIAHNGEYSLKMTIDTTVHHAGCRTFRYPEASLGNTYYYSAWFYLPEHYTIYGNDPDGTRISGWTNLMQFKTKQFGQTGGSHLTWSWGLSNRPDGSMYIVTKWDDATGLPGPSSDYILFPPAPQQFHQNVINVQPRQWFHLEVYLRQNTFTNYNGHITVWQDGVEIFNMGNVITRYPYISALQPSIDSWSMNSYGGVGPTSDTTSLHPRDYTVFVDDAIVSTERIYPLLTP